MASSWSSSSSLDPSHGALVVVVDCGFDFLVVFGASCESDSTSSYSEEFECGSSVVVVVVGFLVTSSDDSETSELLTSYDSLFKLAFRHPQPRDGRGDALAVVRANARMKSTKTLMIENLRFRST